MSDARYNVLFLCTGNSARSIMQKPSEQARCRKVSSLQRGEHLRGSVHPVALELLQSLGYNTRELRPSRGTLADAPQFDFIFTVCDNAALKGARFGPGTRDGALGPR